MGRSKTIPLSRGLVAGETDPIYGQLEVSLINSKTIKIILKRKPYTGRSDVTLSIPCTSLQSFVDILFQAKGKLDDIWLSRVATSELKEKRRAMRAAI